MTELDNEIVIKAPSNGIVPGLIRLPQRLKSGLRVLLLQVVIA